MPLIVSYRRLSDETSRLRFLTVLIALLLVISSGSFLAEGQVLAPQTREKVLLQQRFGFNGSKGGPDIIVNQGDTVRMTLRSNDTTNHDWVLDTNSPSPYDVKAARIRNVGNTTTVQFVANIAGVYKYYCSVAGATGPSHRQRGMEGTFIVNAGPPPPPPPDLSGKVKALEDQLKSFASTATNVNNLATEQSRLKASMESASSQNTVLMSLSGISIILAIVAIAVAMSANRKRGAQGT